MDRSAAGVALVALFAVAVLGVAASSIHSAPIQAGFGVEGGSGATRTSNASSSGGGSGGPGSGVGGGFDAGAFAVGGGSGGTSGGSGISLVLLAGLACVAITGIGLVVWATGDDAEPVAADTTLDTTNESSEEHRSGADTADPDNEVYRAWWVMSRRVDRDAARERSPAEVATTAVEAGLDPEAVTELTTLFRRARYGGAAITDEAERRATAALDRLRTRSDAADAEPDR